MNLEKQDRRTRKTRQQLRGALLSLLKEKRYEDISVQDIIEQADVARSTFYVHYVDKDDLLTGAHGIFAENLSQPMQAHSTNEAGIITFSSRMWFYHIQAQSDILKVIVKDPAMDLAMKTLRGIIHASLQDGMQVHLQNKKLAVPMPLLVDYLADTLMTLIRWWGKNDMKPSPDEMDAIFNQLVVPGVLAVVKGDNHETR